MATTFQVAKNRAKSKLAANITSSATSLTVTTDEGAKFPSAYPFPITIEDEILKCTNRSTDILTVERAQEGTSAVAHVAGKAVHLRITAKFISDLNTVVNTLEGVTKDISCNAYRDTAQSIPTSTWTDVALPLERFDTDEMHDLVTNNERIVCKTAGLYLIGGGFRFVSAATGTRWGQIQLNGTTAICMNVWQGDGEATPQMSVLYRLSINDYVTLKAYQGSGAALDLNVENYLPCLWAVRLNV